MNKSSISGKVFSEQSAVACDGDDGERDVLAGGGYRTLCGKLKTAAAGHLHPHERYAAHVVCVQYLAELFGVIDGVELGTAYEQRSAVYEILVEAAVGVGGAVRCNEKMRTVEVFGLHGGQLELHGPV